MICRNTVKNYKTEKYENEKKKNNDLQNMNGKIKMK